MFGTVIDSLEFAVAIASQSIGHALSPAPLHIVICQFPGVSLSAYIRRDLNVFDILLPIPCE
jgi:hypothetical protein